MSMSRALSAAVVLATGASAVTCEGCEYATANNLCAVVGQDNDSNYDVYFGVRALDKDNKREGCSKGNVPSEYIKMQTLGVGLAKATPGYLKDVKQLDVIVPSDGIGQEAYTQDTKTEGNSTYKYMAQSSYFGNNANKKGYGLAGYANYLVTKGEIETSTNDFLIPGIQTKTMKDVCISKLKANTTDCGDAMKFELGKYKYTQFIATYDSYDAAGKDIPNSYKDFIKAYKAMLARQMVDMTEWNSDMSAGVYFNGDKANTVAEMIKGSTPVTSMVFVSTGGSELTYKFPTYFNEGTYAGETTTPTGSKDIKIYVNQQAIAQEEGDIFGKVDLPIKTSTQFFLDTVYEMAEGSPLLDSKGYAVYDPDVDANKQGKAVEKKNVSSAYGAAGVGAVLAAAFFLNLF